MNGNIYRCRKCGHCGSRPSRIYEPDCISSEICSRCGSENIAVSSVSCSICGEPLFGGGTAYEVKEMLICPECIVKVTV